MSDDSRVAEYRRLPYETIVDRVEDESGTYYICTYPDLPGLTADGETPAEAAWNAEQAFDDYIAARLHFGDPIPEPAGAERARRLSAASAPDKQTVGSVTASREAMVAALMALEGLSIGNGERLNLSVELGDAVKQDPRLHEMAEEPLVATAA